MMLPVIKAFLGENYEGKNRWSCGESNPVPLACEASALPYELQPLCWNPTIPILTTTGEEIAVTVAQIVKTQRHPEWLFPIDAFHSWVSLVKMRCQCHCHSLILCSMSILISDVNCNMNLVIHVNICFFYKDILLYQISQKKKNYLKILPIYNT